ncbi:hypothetical protein GYMLUDRAFT_60621 [Collybiopsis luxurians FD-317 M1]|uniref:Uncharacterized protein n=1 Tax=Collybiopsis luxurians FD-317 M1 TaxID=944289 RepID=A0A0D0BT95_9AGAR|nr:hypothetical protein GYMLUDRAFT_60621 [Collybiopsis luxurians FD-317 M1]
MNQMRTISPLPPFKFMAPNDSAARIKLVLDLPPSSPLPGSLGKEQAAQDFSFSNEDESLAIPLLFQQSSQAGPSTSTQTPISPLDSHTHSSSTSRHPPSSPLHFLPTLLAHCKCTGHPRKTPISPTAFQRKRKEDLSRREAVESAKRKEERKKEIHTQQAEIEECRRGKQRDELDRLLHHVSLVMEPLELGGLGVKSLGTAIDALLDTDGGDSQIHANISHTLWSREPEIVAKILEESPESITPIMHTLFAQEGAIVQEMFTRKKGTTVSELLSNFSLNNVASELEKKAPNIWNALTTMSKNSSLKHWNVGHWNPCLKVNNFQAVISLFLIGSGAAK